MTKIDTLEIQSRPFEYLDYKDVHFDRDAPKWKDFVWGDTQPGKVFKVGNTELELVAIADTVPGTKDYNQNQYVHNVLYNVDGKIWRGHPADLDRAVSPKMIGDGQYDPVSHSPIRPHPIEAPFFGVIKIHSMGSHDKPDFFVQSGGSDSVKPGENFHTDWNGTPLILNEYGRMKPIESEIWAPFALTSKANVGQIKVQVADGEWTTLASIKPDPNLIKPAGPEFRKLTLMVGPTVHWVFEGPNYHWVDQICSSANLKDQETRVFAVLKTGRKLPLTISSYRQNGPSQSLIPCFDFDRDAEVTEGDMIALPDIDHIAVEGREIHTGYVVVPNPHKP